jgi:hypothetical protein
MRDTIFKQVTDTKAETTNPVPETKRPSTGSEVNPAVPYTDYAQQNPYPYLVEYFKLGDTWSEAQGGFTDEIARLDSYFTSKIESGEMANSTNAIKEELKKIEKLTNMNKEERAVIKVETLAAYTDFLAQTEDIKRRTVRYGN